MTKPRKHPLCGYMDADGYVICDAELVVVDGAYACPQGHHLARWEDLSQYTRDHIEYRQGEPTMHEHYFGDRPLGDR